MGDSFIASVQYGDLTGTAAADGHSTGGGLADLADKVTLKPGFVPVGFGMHQLHPNGDGKIPVKIFAADSKKVGSTADEIQAYIAEHGTLPVTGFEGEIEPHEFRAIFKRFSLRLHRKWLNLTPGQIEIEGYYYGDEADDEEE